MSQYDKYDKATQIAGLVRITKQLESIYGNFIDMKDVNSVGESRKEQLITRCIAAHAISLYGDEPDPELAANAVCDGRDDGGIDAVYVNKNSKKNSDSPVKIYQKWRRFYNH